MSQLAIGIIETIGLAAAIEAADVCVKAANVNLIGYELTRGNGMTVVKIEGNVGAVKAAIEAATVAANKVSKVYSKKVIPRPSDSIDSLIRNEKTVGYESEHIVEEIEKEELSKSEELEQQISDTPNLDLSEDDKDKEVEDETQVQDEIEEEIEEIDEKENKKETKIEENNQSEESYTCNLCKDPKCPRVKGDLRSECIHYEDKKEK